MTPPSMHETKYLLELGSMWPKGPDLSWEGSGMGGLREEDIVALGGWGDGTESGEGLGRSEGGPVVVRGGAGYYSCSLDRGLVVRLLSEELGRSWEHTLPTKYGHYLQRKRSLLFNRLRGETKEIWQC